MPSSCNLPLSSGCRHSWFGLSRWFCWFFWWFVWFVADTWFGTRPAGTWFSWFEITWLGWPWDCTWFDVLWFACDWIDFVICDTWFSWWFGLCSGFWSTYNIRTYHFYYLINFIWFLKFFTVVLYNFIRF